MSDQLFVNMQRILPHHLISRMAHHIAENQSPWLKNHLISWFIKRYNVNMEEAEQSDAENYSSFNEFFTRPLKKSARPIASEPHAIISPADGVISQVGDINNGQILQAKGHHYNLLELLAGNTEMERIFSQGRFATIYLSPKDYHRVHMPLTGTLRKMIHVPGRLFSVNQATTNLLPNLFARNERVICLFDTDIGPVAVIMVGAMIVASIETTWHGTVTPRHRGIAVQDYSTDSSGKTPVILNKGDELGRFKLGSTVITLFGKEAINWLQDKSENSTIKMGQIMGTGNALKYETQNPTTGVDNISPHSSAATDKKESKVQEGTQEESSPEN